MKDFIGDQKEKIKIIDPRSQIPYFKAFSHFFNLIVFYFIFNAIISSLDLENWYLSSENNSSIFYFLIRNIYLVTTKLNNYSWILLSIVSYFLNFIFFDCLVFFIDLGIVDCFKLLLSSLGLFGSGYTYYKYILNNFNSINKYNLVIFLIASVFLLSFSLYVFFKSILYKQYLKKIINELINDFLSLSFPSLNITYIYTVVVIIISIILASIISVFDLLTLKMLTKFIFPWVGNNE